MLTTAPAPLSAQVRDLEGGVVRREGRAAKQTEAEARGMPPAGYQHGARSARRALGEAETELARLVAEAIGD